MSCVLRLFGSEVDVDALLQSVPLPPPRVNRKGEIGVLKSRGPNKKSHITIDVSDAEFSDLGTQVGDAIAFMEKHREALRSAVVFEGIEGGYLDFGVDHKDVAIDCKYLPPALLKLAGEAGLGIELSVYPWSPPKSDAHPPADRVATRTDCRSIALAP